VERIVDTDARDVILGSARADTVVSDFGGGDVFRLRGGNDRVELFNTAADLTYAGGKGRDTLQIALGAGDSTLHLADSDRNGGVFEGARITGVEVVSASSVWAGSTFRFFGSGKSERATFAAGAFGGEPLPRAELRLGAGSDRALGGLGDDAIFGGRGRDVLDGGPGDDVLGGGPGRDLFQFAAGFGRDRVPDFDPSADRLDFRGHDGVDRLRDLTIRQSGDDVTISDGAGGRVTLEEVDRADIGADLFLF
jgi:Ca2+-binding RTX toxin-like protein